MRFQFLPHYFKYIGLILFIIYVSTSLVDDFIAGFNGQPYDPEAMSFELEKYLNKKFFDIVGLTGVLMYALSRDKIFDEYMIKFRLESIYLVFFGTMLFILVRILLATDWQMSAIYLFEVQVISFLVLNKIRKYFIFGFS